MREGLGTHKYDQVIRENPAVRRSEAGAHKYALITVSGVVASGARVRGTLHRSSFVRRSFKLCWLSITLWSSWCHLLVAFLYRANAAEQETCTPLATADWAADWVHHHSNCGR